MYWICLLFFVCQAVASEPKQVICLTVPKAGTTLLRKTVELITQTKRSMLNPNWKGASDPQEVIIKEGKPLYVAHLFPITDLIKDWDPDRFVKVLLIRDPRDVMVSFLHHLLLRKQWPPAPDRSIKTLKELPFDDQIHYALSFPKLSPRHSLAYAVDWLKRPDVFIVRFEDLVGEEGGGSREVQRKVLYDLARHMGYPLSWGQVDEIASQLFGGTSTFRKGQIGAWETSYNEANKALFKELLGQTTIDLGYATDLNW